MTNESQQLTLAASRTPCHGHERAGRDGPGWFDSSWELHRGLEVREEWSDDHRVHGWIEEFLAAQRAIGRTASPSTSTAIA